jgi:Beta-propeller repeat
VLVDGDGTVWALGTEEVSAVVDQGILRRYSVDDGSEVGEDLAIQFFPSDMILDADGNLVVVGTASSDTTALNVAVAKYGPDFAELWNFAHNGPGNASDSGNAVALDAEGNVYVTGTDVRLNESGNIWTGKLDADGAAVWAIDYNSMENGLDDVGIAIAVDADGNVIVAGTETVIGQNRNAWLTKYTEL